MKIMISCGEPSGDLYAGALVREIRALDPGARAFGFGGELLQAAGARLVGDYRGLTVTGLVEVLRILPRSLAMYRRLVGEARRERPDVFVAIDFPDFNFRLCAALHRLGVPVVYYVCPQLWAWRPGRMRTIRRVARQVLVIFPFEEALYRRAGVDVEFVGHPLIDLAKPRQARRPFLSALGLNPDASTVALLPGSRPNEVRGILPVLLESIPLIRGKVPAAQFVIARAPNLDDRLFADARAHRSLVIAESSADEALAAADVAITASGTATVQAAIHDCPMVVVYRLAPLTYRIGRPFVQVDMYAMVNLVAGEKIVSELIQEAMTPPAVAAETLAFLTDPARAADVRAGLRKVRERLGAPGASGRAAEAVLKVARRDHGGIHSPR